MARREKWQALRQRAGSGEVLDLLGGPDYTELSDLLLGFGCAMVTLKSGHRGFYLRTGTAERIAALGSAVPANPSAWAGREIWAPAYRVEQIASATGSGDSSLAGFTTAFLMGEPPERCVAAANALGYQNLHGLDAISGIRDWAHTQGLMADMSLPRNPISPGADWAMDESRHLALGPRDSTR